MASLRMVWGIGPALPEEVELSPETEQDIALTLMGLKEQEHFIVWSLRIVGVWQAGAEPKNDSSASLL